MLPLPPPGGPNHAFLVALVNAMEQELRRKISASPRDGVVYLGADQPVSLISPTGKIYRLTVADDGSLETTEL